MSAAGVMRDSPCCETRPMMPDQLARHAIDGGARQAAGIWTLAACCHQTCFLNRDPRASRAQAGLIEIRPDLVGAISADRIGGRQARFGGGNRFVRLHLRSNHRQGNHGHAEERENREGSERFDHLGLLTVAERQSRCARGSIDNTGEDARFRGCQPLFGCLSQPSAAIVTQEQATSARGDTLRPLYIGCLGGMGSASGREWTSLSDALGSGPTAAIRLNQVNKVRALLTAS
jgi:hypothetical protein